MYTHFLTLMLLLMKCNANDYYYHPFNVTRTTLSRIESYRSSLTLDWLAGEDSRQRAMARIYETEKSQARIVNTECMDYPRPSPGKIGRYLLELLKNLEGDDGKVIQELIQSLVRSKILVESSAFESEPNLDSLVKYPEIMMGEPHVTFPRIVATVWMSVMDPSSVRRYGWCPITKVTQFVTSSKPYEVARQMRALDIVVDRARFIMEDFIQQITPLNVYQSKKSRKKASWNKNTRGFTKEREGVASSIPPDGIQSFESTITMVSMTPQKVVQKNFVTPNKCMKISSSVSIIMFIYLF